MVVNLQNGLYKKESKWINQFMINPLKILILNLMPNKKETEKQFIDLFNKVNENIEISFLYLKSHKCKNINQYLLQQNYFCFEQIKNKEFNGMIITGAPVEKLDFDKVDYWKELIEVRNWAKDSEIKTINECWSAQAALFQDYQVRKENLDNKIFEISKGLVFDKNNELMSNIDEISMPQSRNSSSIFINDGENKSSLKVLMKDQRDSPLIVQSKIFNQIYIMGHPEYDTKRLDIEYKRDMLINNKTIMPTNYYDNNGKILNTWSKNSIKLFSNWVSLIER
ncbi:homoserine O-succinyltransferase [Lactobacillus sp. S2-2]|uniref:homoserine O-acetyltransferase/O-succinyltransferase family protein n=1 Tax=Lactobacillus sp. S2-2 TaxID=2692917 RepID=UPI001F40D048|nr:homoserine O-succinyltransferase [Lactobacillus sp. S2-2]MCF6515737.1 homoserine O-succinyltransferase [Lactobacillus sp. S2-2]